ncbi:glycosyltransferase [Luteimonas sp. MJ250]|uniref:glycosyltransferase n=1 Tax=Luteimonas sp. MJ250 TaxID=3129236 RepID=UPI0031BBAF6C
MSEAPHASPGIGRVVLWGTCDTGKPRVRILIDGLRAQGVEVIEIRADPWRGIEDKSQVKGIGRWLGLLARIAIAYPRLAWAYLRAPAHDWVLLGYPSIPDIFVIRLLAWMRGARVAMDWFLSAYDTIVLDRRLVGPRHPLAWLVYAAEWVAVRLADAPFMDTATHARRMEQLFGLAPGACGHVWVGVERGFLESADPAPADHAAPGGPTRVLFYGQFIPLHGIPTIIEAARILREEPVQWTIVGRGQEAPQVRAMLNADPLPALRWVDWIEYAQLRREILSADACLGIFGTSDKAASVIPNKVFQILATGRPLITRDSNAVRELVGNGGSDIALVPAGDADALAAAVLGWHRNPPRPDPRRAGLGQRTTPVAIGRQLLGILQGAKP